MVQFHLYSRASVTTQTFGIRLKGHEPVVIVRIHRDQLLPSGNSTESRINQLEVRAFLHIHLVYLDRTANSDRNAHPMFHEWNMVRAHDAASTTRDKAGHCFLTVLELRSGCFAVVRTNPFPGEDAQNENQENSDEHLLQTSSAAHQVSEGDCCPNEQKQIREYPSIAFEGFTENNRTEREPD